MNPIRIAFGILLAALIATPAYSQEQSAPPTPPPATQSDHQPPPSPPADQSAPPVPRPMRIRIGGNVQAANLVRRVEPVYPQIAKVAHVSGTVILHVVVSRDGSIQTVEVVSGPALLRYSAIDAVKQWRYRPTMLNGEPVEVDTTIQVVFALGETPQEQEPNSAPPASGTIDPQFKADILHLLDVMDVQGKAAKMGESLFASLRPAILSSLPPTPNRSKIADAYLEELTRMLSSSELTDRLVVIYAHYYTDDDVKALADFFQTPAGRHFNDSSAQVFSAGSEAGQAMAREHLPEILRSLCQEYPELKGTANFCSDESKDKKGLLMPPDGSGLRAGS